MEESEEVLEHANYRIMHYRKNNALACNAKKAAQFNPYLPFFQRLWALSATTLYLTQNKYSINNNGVLGFWGFCALTSKKQQNWIRQNFPRSIEIKKLWRWKIQIVLVERSGLELKSDEKEPPTRVTRSASQKKPQSSARTRARVSHHPYRTN